ncbi:MAG: hypothetical protein OWT28_01945 [Firmicutes bacterium]|nr:hypothetical protein [Bacillota bacterium]
MSFFTVNRRRRPESSSRQSPSSKRRTAWPFWAGLGTGVVATVVILAGGLYGTLSYMTSRADQSVVFASNPATTKADNRVQMYFPLERFLAWRSTTSTQMSMQGDRVRVDLSAKPFASLGITLGVAIYGTPAVIHGDFALQNVSGYVDNIPLPKSLVLGAIAADGERYGVHVNDARDTLYVIKNLGDYRLIAYDAKARDLVLSLPVATVEAAAKHQSIM